jgi:D-3-phosphoglycerate dehydrogenase / 2-oxoglutarate reductase
MQTDLMDDRPVILVTTRLFDAAATACLEANHCTVRHSGLPQDVVDTALSGAELDRLLEGADGWIVGIYPVDAAVLARHPKLKVISRRGVGYDTVDVEACRKANVAVTIATGGNEASVSEHAAAMVLALGRRLCESDRLLRGGAWKTIVSSELAGKTVGLVGLGRIARGVIERLRGFRPKFIAFDPSVSARDWALQNDVELTDLETLLASSDVVSLHAPLMPSTWHMIDERALSSMKPGALLVNTARGGLVDDAALLAALREGRIAGAALDVFESEQDPSLEPITSQLLECPNLIATAHAGGSSHEALMRTNLIAAENVLAVLRGQDLPTERSVVSRANSTFATLD